MHPKTQHSKPKTLIYPPAKAPLSLIKAFGIQNLFSKRFWPSETPKGRRRHLVLDRRSHLVDGEGEGFEEVVFEVFQLGGVDAVKDRLGGLAGGDEILVARRLLGEAFNVGA